MGSSPSSDSELHTRVRQQEVVADLGQQALVTDGLDQLMPDASVADADALDNVYCKVLELLSGADEVFLRQGVGWRDGLVGDATVPTDRNSQAGYTLLSEEPIIRDDLRTEEQFFGSDLLTSHEVVSGISVIIGSIEAPWGVLGELSAVGRGRPEDDATFVQHVANVLAAAIGRTDAVFENVRRDLQVKIEKSDVELSTEALPCGRGDGGQLAQVFQNLLENTIEYGGDAPRVRVGAEEDGDRYVRAVRDEGIGIDPEEANRAFEGFESLHAQDEQAGTGTGLALCERIVKRHGGDIWVESEPGDDATFSFTLPAADGRYE